MEEASRTQKQWLEAAETVMMPTYAPCLVLTRGEGARVWDVEGREYLDFLAGIAVNVLGHGHPTFVARVQEQVAELLQVSNVFLSKPQVRLAEELVRRSFADRVFFANSGAEANEGALKLARRFQRVVRGQERFEIIAMNRSFHGRTMFALTATGQPKYHAGFEPMVPGFRYADFNDLDSVAALMNPQTAAVIVEPVQGEGGVIPGDPAFLQGLRQLCDDQGVLLIFDEVQTGMGRTGTLFAHEQLGVTPDILTTAKGLGGGLPIGAFLCSEELAPGFQKGSHATTFGGNPVATAAGLAVLDVMDQEGLLARVEVLGSQLRSGLTTLSTRFDRLSEVRGMGLMLGVEAAGDLGQVVSASRDLGLLHNTAGGRALRFLPPFILTDAELAEGLNRLETALSRCG